jgi:hypothetical protein
MTETTEPVSRVESQSHETAAPVSPAPWLAEGISRATYYRRRAHKSDNPELNNGSRPDNNFKSEIIPDIPPQSELNSGAAAAELKTEAEKDDGETSQIDETALALRKQIEALRQLRN